MSNKRVHGIMALCNTGGIEISLDSHSDYIFYRFNNGDKPEEWQEAEILYTIFDNEGLDMDDRKPYFNVGDDGWKYFLDEFLTIQ